MQFSIIIPAKNEEANIGRCLDSINSVDWPDNQYEVIVVDNGSTDRTVEIAREKRAKVFVKPELTISGLRNFGAGEGAGEILAFLDADCTVTPSWLRKAAPYLERVEIACFGSPPIVPEDATWIPKAWFAVRRKSMDAAETDWLESMNMFVRREPFLACGRFDESLITCEDYDLSLRLRAYGSIVADSAIIAVHHGEAATIGHFFRKELWRGKSNFAGMAQHGFSLAELPSLLAPSLHCLTWLSLGLAPLIGNRRILATAAALFVLWQLLLLMMSFRKLRTMDSCEMLFQLYFLLNVYLLARGVGVFSSGRRMGTPRCAA